MTGLGQCSDSLGRQWKAFYIGVLRVTLTGTNTFLCFYFLRLYLSDTFWQLDVGQSDGHWTEYLPLFRSGGFPDIHPGQRTLYSFMEHSTRFHHVPQQVEVTIPGVNKLGIA